jgi:3-hydroxy-3-methylglutaryl CoA synthase
VSDQIACPGVATDDVVGTIAGTSNSLSMWTFHEVVQNKRIDFAKLHNADGDPIAVSSSAIASAINDYGDQPDATALVLGTTTTSPFYVRAFSVCLVGAPWIAD